MSALPLDDVPAIKVYLDLPLFGDRAPEGGPQELARRQAEDVASQIFAPVVVGAAEELPRVVAELEREGCLAHDESVALFGFSAGGAAALVALEDGKVRVRSTVIVNASTGLTASVRAFERATKGTYRWTAEARALASRTDAPKRAAAIAAPTPPPAILLVQGAADEMVPPADATELYEALAPFYEKGDYAQRLRLDVVAGMGHAWAADTANVARLRAEIGDWFLRF
jgi:pimeloyl-ACP methyl ester carboxylesterase